MSAATTLLLLTPNGAGVTNTVGPTHDYVALPPIIGTQISGTPGTWTGSPTLTYQWYRNASAANSGGTEISGATSINRTPVDADFGYYLYYVEIPNGNAAAAVASPVTARVAELPSQSLGANALADGDMEAANVTSWTNSGGSGTFTKETTSPHGGSRVLRIARNTGNPAAAQSVTATGSFFTIRGFARSDGVRVPKAGSEGAGADQTVTGTTSASWQEMRTLYRATNRIALSIVFTSSPGEYVEFDDWTVQQVTPNVQLTAPSSDMRLDFLYTLPGSPVNGTCVWLLPRVSDFASGNYWLAFLRYTGSQWDINLYSVASHTRTSRISASNIGATDGVRVTMNADSVSLYTTADAGANWTQRGSTITNSTYQSATGVNALYTPDVTAGQLIFANP